MFFIQKCRNNNKKNLEKNSLARENSVCLKKQEIEQKVPKKNSNQTFAHDIAKNLEPPFLLRSETQTKLIKNQVISRRN